MENKIKCNRCKHEKDATEFKSIRGGILKTCSYCRGKCQEYSNRPEVKEKQKQKDKNRQLTYDYMVKVYFKGKENTDNFKIRLEKANIIKNGGKLLKFNYETKRNEEDKEMTEFYKAFLTNYERYKMEKEE